MGIVFLREAGLWKDICLSVVKKSGSSLLLVAAAAYFHFLSPVLFLQCPFMLFCAFWTFPELKGVTATAGGVDMSYSSWPPPFITYFLSSALTEFHFGFLIKITLLSYWQNADKQQVDLKKNHHLSHLLNYYHLLTAISFAGNSEHIVVVFTLSFASRAACILLVEVLGLFSVRHCSPPPLHIF